MIQKYTARKLRDWGRTLYQSAHDLVQHDGLEWAGYLAFLGMLAFFPFLVFFVALAGFVGETQVNQVFYDLILQKLPGQFTAVIMPRVEEIVSGPPPSLVTLSIIGTLWTSSSAVEGMRGALNRAYRVTTPPSYLFRRMMSVVELMVMTAMTFAAMLVIILVPLLFHGLESVFGVQFAFFQYDWDSIRFTMGGAIIFAMVGLSYYILPNIEQRFFSVMPGAMMVMGLWLLAGHLLSVYLASFNQVNIVYGSLAGIIICLVFFYILAVIYIYGAEFNYHVKRLLGQQIVEREAAVKKKGK